MQTLAGIENALSDRILSNLDRLEKWHEPNKIKYNGDKMQGQALPPKILIIIMWDRENVVTTSL